MNVDFNLENENGLFSECSREALVKRICEIKNKRNTYVDFDIYISSNIFNIYFFEVSENITVNMFGSINMWEE